MNKLRHIEKWKWFKRTFTGYTVAFGTVDFTYTVVHRPFRDPIMKTEPTKMNGKHVDLIIFDEYQADEDPKIRRRREMSDHWDDLRILPEGSNIGITPEHLKTNGGKHE